MLFENDIKEAQNKLYEKGYYSCNMTDPYNDQYEICDRDGNIVIDHLSVSQLIQLSKIIAR